MTDSKTVRVRIAVVVTRDGEWVAEGWDGDEEQEEFMLDNAFEHLAARDVNEDDVRVSFVEADVPLPATVTVEGEVTP